VFFRGRGRIIAGGVGESPAFACHLRSAISSTNWSANASVTSLIRRRPTVTAFSSPGHTLGVPPYDGFIPGAGFTNVGVPALISFLCHFRLHSDVLLFVFLLKHYSTNFSAFCYILSSICDPTLTTMDNISQICRRFPTCSSDSADSAVATSVEFHLLRSEIQLRTLIYVMSCFRMYCWHVNRSISVIDWLQTSPVCPDR